MNTTDYKPYEYLDWATADIAFKAYGKNLEQAFANAAIALTNIIVDTNTIEHKEEREFDLEAEDSKALLYDFLDELLFLFDTEGLVFSLFNVRLGNGTLHAVCIGEKVTEKHKIQGEVKAITYHKMEIKKEKGLWCVQVLVDV